MVSRINADIDGPRAACVRCGAQIAGWFVLEGATEFLNVGGRSIFRCSWDFASLRRCFRVPTRVIMGKTRTKGDSHLKPREEGRLETIALFRSGALRTGALGGRGG